MMIIAKFFKMNIVRLKYFVNFRKLLHNNIIFDISSLILSISLLLVVKFDT